MTSDQHLTSHTQKPAYNFQSPIPWEDIEALLHRVQKPGRYVGGEFNAIHKPWETITTHVCLAFPDLYDLGMSNFALQILYELLNRREDTLAERTYLPAPDMIAAMRQQNMPLYALESYRPVAAFDILAISIAYEQLFTNTLETLDLAGLPIRAADRDERHPLVVGGGHGAFNPEPMCDFFDLFIIGEAEEVITELVERFPQIRELTREAQLKALLDIEGLYIPRFYRLETTAENTLAGITTLIPEAPLPIQRRIVGTLPPTPVHQIVPNIETTHDRGVIEIQRGCTHGCRFCQAGIITRPVRERPAQEIIEDVFAIAAATGYSEIGFLSLSSADHTEIETVLQTLQQRCAGLHLGFSLPSLRIDAFSVALAEGLTGSRKSGFTFAPEAASETLRHRINKEIDAGDLLTIAEEVFQRGWRTLKLYFMIGLPGETDEDVLAIADLAHELRRIGVRLGGRKTEIHVSISTFVPKPQTAFQWEAFADADTIARRQALLFRNLRGRGFKVSWNKYPGTRIEALLTRGDRRLNGIIERAWQLGARFDAWDEWWNLDAWEQALAELAPELFGSVEALQEYYMYRERSADETLPWDHLLSGVERRFLLQDAQRSRAGKFLSDCRETCHACGILLHYANLRSPEWRCPQPERSRKAIQTQVTGGENLP